MNRVCSTFVMFAVLAFGWGCVRQEPVTLKQRVAVPSTNHYETDGNVNIRIPLPQSTPVEYSTDGVSYFPVPWGNDVFGDKSFGWYELKPKESSVWLRILSDGSRTNTEAEIVFVLKK